MSDSQFWNFKKSKFSHQVVLVGKDDFIFKMSYIICHDKFNTLQICTQGGASVDTS